MTDGDTKTGGNASDYLDEKGLFKKGNPGGPGRPKGMKSIRKLLKERVSESDLDEIFESYMDRVKGGELTLDFFDRMYGKSKPLPEPIDIELPDITSAEGAQKALQLLAQAALDGEDKDQINTVAAMALKALETGEYRDLLEAIEELKKESGA